MDGARVAAHEARVAVKRALLGFALGSALAGVCYFAIARHDRIAPTAIESELIAPVGRPSNSSGCKTVVLADGRCLPPGTYHGNAQLLFGRHFIVHGRVTYSEDSIIVESAP
jgi:hypothetical protein